MDFVSSLPKTKTGNDAIWVIVDRLTKSAHFLPMRMTDTMDKLVRMYMDNIIRMYGVPVSIVSDRDPRFVSKFWESFHRQFGTKVTLSTAFHPQTDGQSERTIQTLEDMLRACVMDFKGSWADYLTLVEFSYNNSYQASIGMAPFEALYGRKCRSPICWNDIGEKRISGPELVQKTMKVVPVIRECLKAAQDRQKNWADSKRRPLEFGCGEKIYLRISLTRGIIRFGQSGKFSPRYTEPFEILERVRNLAYRLALPPAL